MMDYEIQKDSREKIQNEKKYMNNIRGKDIKTSERKESIEK